MQHGPDSLAALGVNLGLEDLIAICKSNEMCNYLAMDTVSLGCTLAWGGLVVPVLAPLYDYAWFVGFAAAFGVYVALMGRER